MYDDIAPKTTENFRCLCTGEMGGGQSGRPLHYKGCKFYAAVPGAWCQACCQFHSVFEHSFMQGGDTTNGDGTGGEAIYGEEFSDDNLNEKHSEPGTLSMVTNSSQKIGSRFSITLVKMKK